MSDCRCVHFESRFYSACWCKDCEHIKLRCACALLPFKSTQLKSFVVFLEDLQQRKIVGEKQSEVQFKFADISLIFNERELEDLIDLLCRVQIEIMRETLENSFSQPAVKHTQG